MPFNDSKNDKMITSHTGVIISICIWNVHQIHTRLYLILIGLLERCSDMNLLVVIYYSNFLGWRMISPKVSRDLRNLRGRQKLVTQVEQLRIFSLTPLFPFWSEILVKRSIHFFWILSGELNFRKYL